jgi:hypothetical protein
MTKISASRLVVRETDCLDRGRALVVQLKPRHVEIRLKGTRRVYSMSYEGILWLAVKRQVEDQRKEKALLKKEKAAINGKRRFTR